MPNAPSTPRRRWFRFGLRTMFVVLTVFTLWLGWQAKIVRDRKEAIVKLRAGYAEVFVACETKYPRSKWPSIPFWREWLGDRSVAIIVYFDNPEQKRLCALFPEARLIDAAEFET